MSDKEQLTFEFDERPTIKGFPELRWTGKRPYKYTQYFPAQLRERYGEETDGWINKIFWGDNLQVMSHMLKEYRGQIDMIYIDPPFDSKAQYKKTIKINSKDVSNDMMSFKEVQYKDIWTNDTYLQFLYERLIIMRELLKDTGSIWVHCDQSKGHYIKIILDEVFGQDNFVNQITWKRTFAHGDSGQGAKHLGRISDYIYLYGKSSAVNLNSIYVPYEKSYIERVFSGKDDDGRRWQSVSLTAPGGASKGNPSYNFLGVTRYWQYSKANMEKLYAEGKIYQSKPGAVPRRKMYLDEAKGVPLQDIWTDIVPVQGLSNENENYPTQKPITLLERIIKLTSNPGDLVFDCFMGSGTTQAVAMKLGRRFIGADINLGAVQTTTKRLLHIADNLRNELGDEETKYTGFEVYNVNNYDFFRNPVEARDLLIQALEIQPFSQSNVWDGELDGRMVKIMPVNRIATKADLEELKANLPYKIYEKRKEDNPNQPVERITIVCMGHEPDLKAALEVDLDYKLDIEIVDILRDKSELQLKREAEAEIVRENDKLVIRAFYPMNLLQKLSLQKEYVDDWRQLVESIMIDWNYDGVVLQPSVTDIPGKKEMVVGVYDIPKNAGTIKVKITDLLSESLEMEV
ncbi:site-specific DNA-methyltransferase [Phascolarctobacterium succinatutens]|uniref:site-specific DNA-methyltransferase n=1 Tax=Phascolarctobacterium succinatutens TaxID=626940 RepID=UPI0026F109B5|nr:site-specific DNA-methyltransferase [Phascolarctobacterium succinatutens]